MNQNYWPGKKIWPNDPKRLEGRGPWNEVDENWEYILLVYTSSISDGNKFVLLTRGDLHLES